MYRYPKRRRRAEQEARGRAGARVRGAARYPSERQARRQTAAAARSPGPAALPPRVALLLRRARVARLATADPRGQPYAVPVCFAFDGGSIVSVIDAKPKRLAPRRLRRIRNIALNPRVALLVDAYHETWTRLWYVLVLGRAELVEPGTPRHAPAIRLLRRKYRQYRTMPLDEALVIDIVPQRVAAWFARRPARARPR